MIQKSLPKASRLQTNEPGTWPQYMKYVPQVISLRQKSVWSDPPLSLDLPFARLLVDVGCFLWHTGQVKDCEANMKTAEEFISAQDETCRNLPETEEFLSDIYLVTGILADCIGVSKRSDSLDHRVALLNLRKKATEAIPAADVTIEEEIRLGNAWTDLGCAHMQRGQYTEAGQIFERMFLKYRKWGSETQFPYEYSKYYHFSAFVLMSQGNPSQAIRHVKRGVELEEMHAVEVDATVLTTRYSVASLLFNAGKMQESLDLHEEILDGRKHLCREGSQLTLESFEATGMILHLANNNVKARDYLERCLVSQSRANWTTEGLARAQFWLSRVVNTMGEHDSAQAEAQAARSVRDRFLNEYPEYLHENPDEEAAVFDQMLPMWIMQTTGKLQEGGRNPVFFTEIGD